MEDFITKLGYYAGTHTNHVYRLFPKNILVEFFTTKKTLSL